LKKSVNPNEDEVCGSCYNFNYTPFIVHADADWLSWLSLINTILTTKMD